MAVCRMSRADVVHMYIVEHVVGCRNLQYNTREEVVYTRRTQKNPEGELQAKRQVRGVQESPEMVRCCLSGRLNMITSALERAWRGDSDEYIVF